jgi:hypothetical protein
MRILIGIVRAATSPFLVHLSTKYTLPLMMFVHRKSLFFLGQVVIFPVQICLIAFCHGLIGLSPEYTQYGRNLILLGALVSFGCRS